MFLTDQSITVKTPRCLITFRTHTQFMNIHRSESSTLRSTVGCFVTACLQLGSILQEFRFAVNRYCKGDPHPLCRWVLQIGVRAVGKCPEKLETLCSSTFPFLLQRPYNRKTTSLPRPVEVKKQRLAGCDNSRGCQWNARPWPSCGAWWGGLRLPPWHGPSRFLGSPDQGLQRRGLGHEQNGVHPLRPPVH